MAATIAIDKKEAAKPSGSLEQIVDAPDGSAAVVESPPLVARHEALPMSTGSRCVKPGVTAQITSRPQRPVFRPMRVFVSEFSPQYKAPWWKRLWPWYKAPKTNGSADWLINDITIGNRSQFAQAGSLPGDLFGRSAADSFVTFDEMQAGMDIVFIVTYIGPIKTGCPFAGAVLGTSAR